LITELRNALEQTEASTRRPGMRTAVWVEKMAAENAEVPEEAQSEEESPRPRMMMDIRMLMRYGLLPKGFKLVQDPNNPGGGMERIPLPGQGDEASKKSQASTNEVSVINLTCRAVSWNKLYATADTELCNAFLKQLLSSPMFMSGTNGTQLSGQYEQDEATGTFKFDVKLKLAKPIKL